MSAHDKTERVLRDLHVLLSKSEPYPKEPSKVIVDKQQMLDLLSDLNKSIYEIMDEYEMTQRSRDKAEREFQKKGDQIVWDASRKAEDIYAASVLYTDEALNQIQEIMKESNEKVKNIYSSDPRELSKYQSYDSFPDPDIGRIPFSGRNMAIMEIGRLSATSFVVNEVAFEYFSGHFSEFKDRICIAMREG